MRAGKTSITHFETENQAKNHSRVYSLLSVPERVPFFSAPCSGGNWVDGAKELTDTRQGELLNLKAGFGKRPPTMRTLSSYGRRRRGIVKEFSYHSRTRLIKKLHTIDYEKMGVPLFLTLTYPAFWEKDFQVWKRQFDYFCDELSDRYPDSCLIWKIEPQQRGAPHFHCLVFGADCLNTPEGRQWLSAAWYRIVGSADERHLRAGTRVEFCKSLNQLRKYLLKYIGKKEEYQVRFGRIWGLRGRRNLVFAPIVEDKLTKVQFLRLRRLIRKYLEARRRRNGGKKRRHRDIPGGNWVILPPSEQQRLLDHILSGSPDSS